MDRTASFGVLKMQPARDADFLATLQQWGDLDEVISLPEAAALLAKLCSQSEAALLRVLSDAVMMQEIRFWGMSDRGHWVEGMIRILHPLNAKPRIRPPTETHPGSAAFSFDKDGRLHTEAMGINPADAANLLRARGRRVPAALLELVAAPPKAAAAPDAPAVQAPAPNKGAWKATIQMEAGRYMKELRKCGASPTVHSILDRMANWCRENNVKTGGGIFPTGGYLRTHVLGGKHWTPPD